MGIGRKIMFELYGSTANLWKRFKLLAYMIMNVVNSKNI